MNTITQIKELLDQINTETGYKIGIGITTHNRYEVFTNTLSKIKEYAPKNSIIVVVDDASTKPVPEADFRFNQNVGIAKAKNKCLELLYLKGCEHYFLFDDDTYPKVNDWWQPYVESKEPHLNYIFSDFATGQKLNDTIEIYRNDEIVAYSHARGCMMYYAKEVLEVVGGMDTIFGKWGFEHPSLSDRIYMAGLTSFRYMDVVNSSSLIYSCDEHKTVTTTTAGEERKKMIARNTVLYEERKNKNYYFPFIDKKNILLTCYFTGVSDPQRGAKWNADIEHLKPLINSLKSTKLIIFHDCFDEPDTENVTFIKVKSSQNPYYQRWITYRSWMLQNKKEYENVFCIDGTDVEVLKEPYWNDLGNSLWTGYEHSNLDCEWMVKTNPNAYIKDFIQNNKGRQLLNAGIVGGSLNTLIEFIGQLLDFWSTAKKIAYYEKKPDAGNYDMGLFNYIAYTNWKNKLKTGSQVCTIFKAEEKSNNVSWFKHK